MMAAVAHNTLAHEAEAAHRRGWALTPLRGKVPTLPAWQAQPVPSIEQVRSWARGNVGLRTGAISGVAVLDIDTAKGGAIPAGLPDTVTVLTGGGGYHLYYAIPDGATIRNSSGTIAHGVDVRGENGQVVYPGSVHPNTGAIYQWQDGHSPDDLPLAPFPLWLLEAKPARVTAPTLSSTDRVRRCQAYIEKMDPAISGSGGHNATFAMACKCFEFGLSTGEAQSVMQWANNAKCIPPWTERDLEHKINDAYNRVVSANEVGRFLHEDPPAGERRAAMQDKAPAQIPLDVPDESPRPADVSQWLNTPAPLQEFLFDGVVPVGTVCGLDAMGGTGKSWFTQQLIFSAASGKTIIPTFAPTDALKVLWLCGEDPEQELHRRAEKICTAFDFNDIDKQRVARNLTVFAGHGYPLVSPSAGTVVPTPYLSWLQQQIQTLQPRLIVLDPRCAFFAGDENSNSEVGAFFYLLRGLTELVAAGAAVWVCHHVSKGREMETGSAAGRGASAARDAMRVMFNLVPLSEKEMTEYGISNPHLFVKLAQGKANWSPRMAGDVFFKRDTGGTGGVLRAVDMEAQRDDVQAAMLDHLAEKLGQALGDNPENITVYEVHTGPSGKPIRDSLKDELGGVAVTGARLRGAIERGEKSGVIDIEKDTSKRAPRLIPRQSPKLRNSAKASTFGNGTI